MIAQALTFGNGLPWPLSIRRAVKEFGGCKRVAQAAGIEQNAIVRYVGGQPPKRTYLRDALARLFGWTDFEMPDERCGEGMPDGYPDIYDLQIMALLRKNGRAVAETLALDDESRVRRRERVKKHAERVQNASYGVDEPEVSLAEYWGKDNHE